MPREPAGHRMDRESDPDATLPQPRRDLCNWALGLRRGHIVAGHDQHRPGAGEHRGHVRGIHHPGFLPHPRVQYVRILEGAQERSAGRSAHGPAHVIGQDRAEDPGQGTRDDEDALV